MEAKLLYGASNFCTFKLCSCLAEHRDSFLAFISKSSKISNFLHLQNCVSDIFHLSFAFSCICIGLIHYIFTSNSVFLIAAWIKIANHSHKCFLRVHVCEVRESGIRNIRM